MKLKALGKGERPAQRSWLARWEVRVKLVTCLAVAFLLVPVKNPGALLGYALFLFALLFLAKLSLRKILTRLLMLFPFLTFLAVPVLLGGGLPPSPERVEVVLLLTLKAVCTVFLLFIIIFTQPVQLIFNGMGHMRLPDKLVSVLFLSWRYVFLFWEKLAQTYKALRSRLFQGGVNRRAYQVYGEIIGGLFVKSIDSSERVYKAMLSRGYTGKSVVAAAEKITAWDLFKSAAMLTSAVLLHFI
ncbi:MAG: cobalt ECF transporter T component CbiQ [Sporomusaceae bacterium]|jgi:cobalt/nickel transport system permease protein|nr:cobalt ECF transporter T component CbiQ [Sporomusaceae bacterium]